MDSQWEHSNACLTQWSPLTGFWDRQGKNLSFFFKSLLSTERVSSMSLFQLWHNPEIGPDKRAAFFFYKNTSVYFLSNSLLPTPSARMIRSAEQQQFITVCRNLKSEEDIDWLAARTEMKQLLFCQWFRDLKYLVIHLFILSSLRSSFCVLSSLSFILRKWKLPKRLLFFN